MMNSITIYPAYLQLFAGEMNTNTTNGFRPEQGDEDLL